MKRLWISLPVGLAACALLLGYAAVRNGRSLRALAGGKTGPAHSSWAPAHATAAPNGNSLPVLQFAKNPPPVPQFLINAIDGEPVSTAAWKGKVVVLNFWATWCGYCRAEIPALIRLQSDFGNKLQVVGISVDDLPPSLVLRFAKETGINYPILMNTRDIERAFGFTGGLPTTFVVDTHGGVVQKHVGSYPPSLLSLEIQALLNLPVDARVETFEDHGQIFPARATDLPGVSFAGLAPEQKRTALREMNEESCPCGCRMTVAECRIKDPSCKSSSQSAAKIVKKTKSAANPAISDSSPAPSSL